jgi:predicted DCC family thiol-disulfide oxidoreductase YuxK
MSSPTDYLSSLSQSKLLLAFDDHCVLCTSWVQRVIRHNSKGRIFFIPLSRLETHILIESGGLKRPFPDSLILVYQGKTYIKSSAALMLAKYMDGLYPILAIGFIIPSFIRNAAYDFIAKNRYKWFGKREACWMPNAELKQRFPLGF